jgi:demethylmenaquinone methyltransferase/2-methoxy-6-polyprenyl-1,4-benzoquinol methylase
MPYTYSIAEMMRLADVLREPVMSTAIQVLKLPLGSRGLDAGCGIGSNALRLAEAVGPQGHVAALDISTEFLACAKEAADKSGLSTRISLHEGDVSRLQFDDQSFDWVWSSDCVGYPFGQRRSALDEFVRVARPGGTIAILGWTFQQVLPGYPMLEARLNANYARIASHVDEKKPEMHFMHSLGWFEEKGLSDLAVQNFAGNIQAPLDEDARKAMVAVFEMLWAQPQSESSAEDWAEYERLCRPDSPDFILNTPDYCAFFVYTMFCGKVPEHP